MILACLFSLLLFLLGCEAQNGPNTFPHAYPGMPATAFGPDWQTYFEVTGLLPNLTNGLSRNFAGNVGVNRANHPNATLFFWAFEKANGSLTGSAASTDPWIIWLNGGPGTSSLLGLLTENGPLRVNGDYSVVQNNYSWQQLADTIWVDQPVGTGYSTSDTTGYAPNQDQIGLDFVGFLSNMVKIFPSLATRPLYLMGESYAGKYIPYITKTIFSTPNPPVVLKKIVVGDGSLGSLAAFEELPTLTIIETYPQLINYDPDVYAYFKTQEHLCGYDLNFTCPQNGHFSTLVNPFTTISQASSSASSALKSLIKSSTALVKAKGSSKPLSLNRREAIRREESRQEWKRSLAGRADGTLDPMYGCYLLDEMWDYAVNFSSPWASQGFGSVDVYDITDALDPEIPSDPSALLNDATVKAAIHASTSKDWVESFDYPFASTNPEDIFGDPSVPMVFLSELATNASAQNVGIVFYSGNDDSLVAHRGTEVIIQNMTFGGVQGFTRRPSTPFTDDEGNFAGIIHQERGLTYALFQNAGHLVPHSVPAAAFTFVRDFVLGSNTTGLVDSNSNTVSGGEDGNLKADALPGNSAIFHWASQTGGAIASAVAPSATLAAWSAFIATETAALPASGPSSTGSTPQQKNAAVGRGRGESWPWSFWMFILIWGSYLL
ncbi:Carboxypeptidase [Mycena sanguinolenta]|uniref:Carboxypeptidase n=1 Tax=Mycena sanguinolenta TaxID=230812 RepID=A0A8H6ZFI4_9AGAR|nr:Carboxypeptidase [Mycena sanguinolenta]